MRLKRKVSLILLLTLLIFHIILGIVIAVVINPFASSTNALIVAGILITLSAVAYAVLRLIFKLTEQNTLSDSYLALSNSLADRAVVFDEDGYYVEILNPYHHTQIPQVTNVIGKRVDEVFDEIFSTFVLTTIRKTIADGNPSIIEYEVFSDPSIPITREMITEPNSRIVKLGDDNQHEDKAYFEARIVPFVDYETGRKCVVWTSRDITERIDAQETALELSVERDKVKFLNEFVSNMTHDFKTPLAIINTNAYIIRKANDETTRDTRVERIQEEVKKLESMIDDMLESARLESEQLVTMERLSLVPVLQTCIERLQSKANDKSIELSFDDDTILGSVVVQCNRQEILRAFINVMDNAIKYTDVGGKVTVTLNREGNNAVVRIQDTGIGIPEEDHEHIFTRFYRTANGRFHTSGTGLGLSIVKLIMERHSGTITVDSAEGKGTTFIMMLPVFITLPIKA